MVGIAVGVANGFAPDYWSFIALRVVHAVLASGHTETNFVLRKFLQMDGR